MNRIEWMDHDGVRGREGGGVALIVYIEQM